MTNDLLTFTVAVAVCTFHGVAARQPFIIYSTNSTWGIHMQAHGRTLNPQDAYANISAKSICVFALFLLMFE